MDFDEKIQLVKNRAEEPVYRLIVNSSSIFWVSVEYLFHFAMDLDEKIQLMKNRAEELNERKVTTSISSKGLSITWTNLNVVAEQKKRTIFKRSTSTFEKIIHNVNGAVDGGTLVAILGASGSGKSTLMSALANRVPGGLLVDGDIRIGRKPIGGFVKYVSGFVYQDDLFIPTLTVLEHLNFIAKLRMDKNISEKARKNRILDVLTELGLMKIANSRIGVSKFDNVKVNLSGGEQKRLSIATELVTDPSLLFCDEPTTGLDSFTALKVVSSLENLVNERQKTIICSIHQPNYRIFALFHRIILLSEGKIAFSGNSDEALEFFKSQNYPYSEDQNPADYLVRSLAAVAENADGAHQLCSAYENTTYYAKMMTNINHEYQHENNYDHSMYLETNCNGPSWIAKLLYMSHRSYLITVRDLSVQCVRIIQQLVMGIVLGLCLRGSITATQTGVQALTGVIIHLASEYFLSGTRVAMAQVHKQMPIFLREYANSTTTSLIFYSTTVLSLLSGIFEPLPFTLVLYGLTLTDLQPELWSWMLTYLIVVLLLNISSAFGLLWSTIFSEHEVEIAQGYAFVFELVCFIYSGIYIKLSSVPPILGWIRYVSWLTYGMESLYIVNTVGFGTIECPENTELPCIKNRSEILASYDYDEKNLVPNIFKMLGICFIMHIFAYLSLLNRIRRKV